MASLQQVCGKAYQLAGAVGAPVKALDNLAAAAACGKPMPHATLPAGERGRLRRVRRWPEHDAEPK